MDSTHDSFFASCWTGFLGSAIQDEVQEGGDFSVDGWEADSAARGTPGGDTTLELGAIVGVAHHGATRVTLERSEDFFFQIPGFSHFFAIIFPCFYRVFKTLESGESVPDYSIVNIFESDFLKTCFQCKSTKLWLIFFSVALYNSRCRHRRYFPSRRSWWQRWRSCPMRRSIQSQWRSRRWPASRRDVRAQISRDFYFRDERSFTVFSGEKGFAEFC